MRDPERIEVFCDQLRTYWKRVPDWRFGQLIENVLRASGVQDPFYCEDDEMLSLLRDFFEPMGKSENKD